ncbi:hypothetical protein [Liquorilactobacillus oeni]|uniref:Uncharacterized protein n=1 Tax=Liquorilactobacillus oeni DSM 19972 TaxID=1423777 RepID=A0A0R1MJ68_9LACO|nr:hypothetical protein [Liquorilactobacillus oeni]KRL05194.1 hypothetical protein FD46_GL001145 [Liquorilactobacillus oeni DSM 19972]
MSSNEKLFTEKPIMMRTGIGNNCEDGLGVVEQQVLNKLFMGVPITAYRYGSTL